MNSIVNGGVPLPPTISFGAPPMGSFGVPYPGLIAGIQEALELPTMAGVGGAINNLTQGNGMTNCSGWATIRGVGGKQARDNGALYSDYPQTAGGSIRGGTFGTVAVQKGFLGLSTRQLRTYGTQISITPAISSASSTQLGGPAGPWTVSDYGDPNIQATEGVAFDLYRFPTKKKGDQFGKQIMPVVIGFPSASGGKCPPGYTVAK
jgi:hypothetical protein